MTSPRNLLLAALGAAVLLPATAQASTVERAADGTVLVRAAAGELNNIHVKPEGTTGVRVKDFGATLSARGSACVPVAASEVVCRTGVPTSTSRSATATTSTSASTASSRLSTGRPATTCTCTMARPA